MRLRPRLRLPAKVTRAVRGTRRLVALVAGLVILAILPIVIWQLRSPFNKVAAAWFDANYAYRQLVTFGNTGSADSNKKVKLDIDTATLITASKLQSDCDDMRFTDLNGRVLDYYLDSAGGACNTSSTDVYVLLPTITTGTNNFYFYYGNPSAIKGSLNAQFSQATFSPTSGPSFASEEVTPGPSGEWHFDEGQGQTVNDATSNNQDGTLGANSGSSTDDPSWLTEDQCVQGKCLRFDGSNDFVAIPDNAAQTLTTAWTISTWIRPISMASAARPISKGQEWAISVSGGNVTCIANASAPVSATSVLTLSKWSHITCRYDGSTMKIFVNGVERASAAYTTNTADDGSTLYLGARGAASEPLNGDLDEPKIYAYARTAAQLQADYSVGASVLGAVDQSNLSDGLVGHWKMDEASWTNNCSTGTALDASGNSNNARSCPNSTGPTGGSAGKFGRAGTFDNTDDYLMALTSTSLDVVNASVSVSAWVNPTSLGSIDGIAGKQNGSAYGYGIMLLSNGIRLQSRNAAQTEIMSCDYTGGALPTSTWSFVAGTIEDTGTGVVGRVYLNGTEVQTCTSAARVGTSGTSFLVGAMSDGTTNFFDGRIDDVRIYKRVISGGEVAQLNAFAPNPVGYWKLDDKTGTTAVDSSGGGNNGTLTGSPDVPTWTQGKIGGAVELDGVSGYVNIANESNFDFERTQPFSMQAWVYRTDTSGYHEIMAKQDTNANSERGYRLVVEPGSGAIYNNNGLIFDLTNTVSSNWLRVSAPGGITANTWYHVAVTYDGSSSSSGVRVYVNGQPVTATSQANTLSATTLNNVNFTLGRTGDPTNANYFPGNIDEAKIYNYTRTPAQVQEDFATSPAPTQPSEAGQVLPKPFDYYSLDEQTGQTANNTGTGGSANNGTLGATSGSSTDDPTWVTAQSNNCKVNGCLSFDGGSDYVTTGDQPATEGIAQLSYGGWVRPTSANTLRCIICKSRSDNTQLSWALLTYSVSGSTTQIIIGAPTNASDPNTYAYTANYVLSNSTWTHVMVVFDGTQTGNSNRLKVYINGVANPLTYNGTIPAATIATTSDVRIGSSSDNSRYFTGNLDEIKVYNTALTASQVAADMAGGSTVGIGTTGPTETSLLSGGAGTGPVAYWSLDEKTGTTANDKSGNNMTGTLTNGPTWTQGKVGQAVKFDGVNDYINIGTQASLSPAAVTTSAWIKTTQTSQAIVLRNRSSGYGMHINSYSGVGGTANKASFWIYGGAAFRVATSTTSINDGNWHFIQGSYDGTTVSIYVDGILEATTSYTGSITYSGNYVAIGRDGDASTDYFAGSIDEVKIYNYALSAPQIAYDYNRGAPVLYWQLDECQGSTLYDAAGKGNSATITIGAAGTQTAVGTCQTSGTAWGNGAIGKYNSGLTFDGTDDGAVAADGSWNKAAPITYSVWFYNTSTPASNSRIFEHSLSGALSGAFAYTASNGRFAMYDGATTDTGCLTGGSTVLNTWIHVAVVLTSTSVSCYRDGILRQTVAISGFPKRAGSLGLGYRASVGDNRYNGRIDDFRVYHYDLTADQIKQVYNQGSAVRYGPTSGSP